MRPLRALGIYTLVVFLGGSLIAPWLYWLMRSVSEYFPHLASSPFHRFVNRSLLAVALLGLWPLLRSLNVSSWKDVGLLRTDSYWRRLCLGFAVGFVSLATLALAALAAGARMPTTDFHHLGQKVAGAALTAITVATIEEILFRGGIFGALRRSLNWMPALFMSSMIYALVHFMESARQVEPVVWYSGLELLPRMLRGFVHWQQLVPGFFNLTLVGALLALAFYRTGNLYFSIGLHAGWIFWLKSYGVLTKEVKDANVWIWGGSKMIDGWLAVFILVLTVPAVFYLSAPSRAHSSVNSAGVTA